MKRWSLRLIRRKFPIPESPPEFGVRLTLKKGDKVVSRGTRDEIRIVRISEDVDDVADATRPEQGQVPPSGGGPP
jgi:hypothetical protein